MLDRLQRSWDLAMQCLAVLREDKTLLVFPLFSTIAIVLITASFAVPLWPLVAAFEAHAGRPPDQTLVYILLFAFYFIQFSVVNFFNTALVEVAMRRFDGGEAGVADGLRRAWARLPVILMYSAVAATVGTILRIIEERVGFVGRLVIGLIGFVWAVATSLVVPVLAAEDVGPYEAITRSAELIRRTWGEQIIGNAGIGLVFALFVGVAGVIGALAAAAALAVGKTLAIAVVVVLVLVVCLLVMAQATLQGIYAAALYRYADGDAATGGLDPDLLGGAFRARD
jgi:hypothetical protein